jgi:hypothetical protein
LIEANWTTDQKDNETIHFNWMMHWSNLLCSWRWENCALDKATFLIVLNVNRVILTKGHWKRDIGLFLLFWREKACFQWDHWNLWT